MFCFKNHHRNKHFFTAGKNREKLFQDPQESIRLYLPHYDYEFYEAVTAVLYFPSILPLYRYNVG